jgi:fumarylacetoacetase
MTRLNETHDPELRSWVQSANAPDCDFPIQNLPFGVFSPPSQAKPRVGVAIGDQILDLAVLSASGLLPLDENVLTRGSLNAFMALEPTVWSSVRGRLSELLTRKEPSLPDNALVAMSAAHLHLPIEIGGYTDFYASREHATNVGTMFRDPKNALMPNWLHIPIGYNGRASTVIVSGTDVHRPLGQVKAPGDDAPILSPSRRLDIELEMGAVVGGSNAMGRPISIDQADCMIFGFVLLNDWSARDIQVWEYQPLGPFQSKAFATTISPWVVTDEALAPYRVDGPRQDPAPLSYLRQSRPMNFDIDLAVDYLPVGADVTTTICRTNFKYMYWSAAQQLAHHAISGCKMEPGDLLGSGTISGPTLDSFGSLLELTWNGRDPLSLENGVKRTFIEDGDTLILRGWCEGPGHRVGFGEAMGRILPAVEMP